jgi:hypothetical protein
MKSICLYKHIIIFILLASIALTMGNHMRQFVRGSIRDGKGDEIGNFDVDEFKVLHEGIKFDMTPDSGLQVDWGSSQVGEYLLYYEMISTMYLVDKILYIYYTTQSGEQQIWLGFRESTEENYKLVTYIYVNFLISAFSRLSNKKESEETETIGQEPGETETIGQEHGETETIGQEPGETETIGQEPGEIKTIGQEREKKNGVDEKAGMLSVEGKERVKQSKMGYQYELFDKEETDFLQDPTRQILSMQDKSEDLDEIINNTDDIGEKLEKLKPILLLKVFKDLLQYKQITKLERDKQEENQKRHRKLLTQYRENHHPSKVKKLKHVKFLVKTSSATNLKQGHLSKSKKTCSDKKSKEQLLSPRDFIYKKFLLNFNKNADTQPGVSSGKISREVTISDNVQERIISKTSPY